MNGWRVGTGIIGVGLLFTLALAATNPLNAGAIPVPCQPTWEVLDGPNVGDGNNYLAGVSGTSSTDVWAVGNYEPQLYLPQTLILHFDGTAWTVLPSPNLGTVYNYLTGVAAISTKDAWAVGWYQSVGTDPIPLILHWDGTSWTTVPAPELSGNGSPLWGVTAISSDDVWAVGAENGGSDTLALHWDGVAWKLVTTPDAGDSANVLKGVTAVSSTDVWAAGYYYAGADGYKDLTVHWDGSTWSVVPGPVLAGEMILLSIEAAATDDVWAVGATGSPIESLTGAYAQHWDGKAWAQVPVITEELEGFLSGVAVVGTKDVWVSGEQFEFDPGPKESLAEHWDGTSWTAASTLNVGTGDNTLSAITALSTDELLSVGSYQDADTGVFRTLIQQMCPVKVRQSGFSPASINVQRGDTVTWSIPQQEGDAHTVTDGTRLRLFNSGLRAPGSSFVFTFVGAGTYRVIDRATGHTMTVRVPIAASPETGGTETEFQITWAADSAPLGYVYDVAIRRPGSSVFAAWRTGVTDAHAKFLPDAGPGQYAFRARMRVKASTAASAYSRAVVILVT